MSTKTKKVVKKKDPTVNLSTAVVRMDVALDRLTEKMEVAVGKAEDKAYDTMASVVNGMASILESLTK